MGFALSLVSDGGVSCPQHSFTSPAALGNAYRDLLDMFFTVPEQLNGEWALLDDPGPLVPQEFAGPGGLAGHQALSILLDDVHE
jgi:hypothetical protein